MIFLINVMSYNYILGIYLTLLPKVTRVCFKNHSSLHVAIPLIDSRLWSDEFHCLPLHVVHARHSE